MRRGPGIFSWLIYRVTTPAIRELFMAPSERFGLQAALVSVLAGDIFGRTRWRAGLAIFQAIYYIKSLFMLRQSVAAGSDEAKARQQWAAYTLLGRTAAPQEIAEAILLAASPRGTYLTGSVIMADGGATAGRRV